MSQFCRSELLPWWRRRCTIVKKNIIILWLKTSQLKFFLYLLHTRKSSDDTHIWFCTTVDARCLTSLLLKGKCLCVVFIIAVRILDWLDKLKAHRRIMSVSSKLWTSHQKKIFSSDEPSSPFLFCGALAAVFHESSENRAIWTHNNSGNQSLFTPAKLSTCPAVLLRTHYQQQIASKLFCYSFNSYNHQARQ